MPLDHHWLFFALEDDEAAPLGARFEAARPVGLPSTSRRALARWHSKPETLLTGDAGLLVGFHAAFAQPWAGEVSRELRRTHGLGFARLTFPRLSPAQLLFCGIGPRRALWLPGLCGNLLVPRESLERALEDVDRACDLSWESFLESVTPYASGVVSEAELGLLLEALPRAFEHALEANKALLALSVSDAAFE